MNNKIYSIVYSPTEENYIGTIVSMLSVLENNKQNKIKFYLVLEKCFEKSLIQHFEIYKKYENCLDIVYEYIDSFKYKKVLRGINFNNNYFLFEYANIIKEDKFLFLKPFSLVDCPLDELFEIDITEHSCLSTECLGPKYVQSVLGNTPDILPINHMLLVNSKKWKEKRYYETFINGNYSQLGIKQNQINDVMIFIHLVKDAKIIDFKYNYVDAPLNSPTCSEESKQVFRNLHLHIEDPIMVTFLENPVNEKCNHPYTNLWWKYAEKTDIYEEIKEFRQLNKYKLSATSAQNSFNYSWLLSRIMPYIKPYWFRIIIGFAIAIPLGLLDGVTALALKPYMDYVIGGTDFNFEFQNIHFSIESAKMAFIIPIGVILFAALQGVLRYLNGYCSTWVSQRITNDVKFDLFERLIHMHPQFFDDNSSGIVISRYMSDAKTASAGIVDNIKTITTSLCGALGLIAVMIYSSWQLAFIGILVLCIAFIPVILIRKRIKDASNKNMVIGGNITTNINETYSGNKVMAAYGLQERQNAYFKEQTWKSFNINMSLYKRSGWMSPMMYLIASFGIATVLGVGTYLINSGKMTAGGFASFTTSLLLLYKPVKTLGNTLTGIQNIFVAMGRVFELFDLTPAITDCKNPQQMAPLQNEIRFENVLFEYVPNKPVLRNINLTIPKNETLAIVGNSGGGKSTLVNLIPRFYDIKSGSIKFDGVDIKDLSIKSLRKNISMVFQDNFLFTGTIKENIMMGNPDATTEELMAAIKAAHLQDMITELPDGLDTELGERGLTLSGGQRQRVAIARAMLRNAPIVILDEATSALDNESEAIVQKAMDNLMQNRTVFIIAHRLSTIKNADRIAVINEGELIELGSHEDLMQIENGQYKALYEMQFRQQEAAV